MFGSSRSGNREVVSASVKPMSMSRSTNWATFLGLRLAGATTSTSSLILWVFGMGQILLSSAVGLVRWWHNETGISETMNRSSPQFSLRWLLVCVTILSAIFAIAAISPRLTVFAVSMTFLFLLPLAIIAGVIAAIRMLSKARTGGTATEALQTPLTFRKALLAPVKLLTPRAITTDSSLSSALAVALVSCCVFVGLRVPLRDIGTYSALIRTMPAMDLWNYVSDSLPRELVSGAHWQFATVWAAWSLLKWWLLFGVLLVFWSAVSLVTPKRRSHSRPHVRRFLLFFPWLVALDMAIMLGTWITEPIIVPEPSSLFVVGVFSWDKWHWDVWMDKHWLMRTAVPTLLAGTVFFNAVLGWRRSAAMIAGILLIPVVVMLSVAWSCIFRDEIMPIFGW